MHTCVRMETGQRALQPDERTKKLNVLIALALALTLLKSAPYFFLHTLALCRDSAMPYARRMDSAMRKRRPK